MPPDSANDRFAGLDAVTRRMCETLLGLEHDFARTNAIIEEAKAEIGRQQNLIAAAQGGLDQLRANAWKLQEAGVVMGYDLFKLMEQTRPRASEPEIGPPSMPPPTAITEPPLAEFSVKDFVLEQVRSAYPEFATAAAIQAKLKELGHAVHPKTVGMSLYRWSKEGLIRRDGKANWIYVPEDERLSSEDESAIERALEAAD